jgi:hypothetical protein
LVVPGPADDDVVAVVALEGVVALAADQRVVAGAADQGETDDIRRQGGRIDRVIAVAAVDRQKVAGFRVVDVDPGRQPRSPQRRSPWRRH